MAPSARRLLQPAPGAAPAPAAAGNGAPAPCAGPAIARLAGGELPVARGKPTAGRGRDGHTPFPSPSPVSPEDSHTADTLTSRTTASPPPTDFDGHPPNSKKVNPPYGGIPRRLHTDHKPQQTAVRDQTMGMGQPKQPAGTISRGSEEVVARQAGGRDGTGRDGRTRARPVPLPEGLVSTPALPPPSSRHEGAAARCSAPGQAAAVTAAAVCRQRRQKEEPAAAILEAPAPAPGAGGGRGGNSYHAPEKGF